MLADGCQASGSESCDHLVASSPDNLFRRVSKNTLRTAIPERYGLVEGHGVGAEVCCCQESEDSFGGQKGAYLQ